MARNAKAIHVIEKKHDTQHLRPVDGRHGVWRTAYWVIGEKTRSELVGGTVYVHEGQLTQSHAGGKILEISHVPGTEPKRCVITFKRSAEAEGIFSEKAGWGNEKKIDWHDVESKKVKIVEEDDESSYPEGAKQYKKHLARERDADLALRAKRRRLKLTGKLACEVCEFNFAETYGQRGEGFIEAHHKIPVAKLDGKTKTKISDLAMVCSNCHRMLHRGNILQTVERLRAELLGET
jgi:5-methylcytosine-specific restriction endonuclease McrA